MVCFEKTGFACKPSLPKSIPQRATGKVYYTAPAEKGIIFTYNMNLFL